MTRVAALALALLAGCASYSNRLAARPLAPDRGEVGLGVDALVVERGRDYVVLPVPEVTYRRGLRPGLDVGGKAHLLGAEGSLRASVLARDRLAIAAAGGLALGYEPVTNNTTDLIHARATARLVGELTTGRGARWPTLIAAVSPSLGWSGPLTMFRGRLEESRLIVRPGAALAARFALPDGRALWLELSAQPAYALGEGWLAPAFQSGAIVTF